MRLRIGDEHSERSLPFASPARRTFVRSFSPQRLDGDTLCIRRRPNSTRSLPARGASFLMMKAFAWAGIVSAFWLGSASSLVAHGGRYGGPNGTVPPNTGGGGDTGNGGPGGPNTPGPTGPTTPNTPGHGGPNTGGSPGAPSTPSTPNRGVRGGMTKRGNTGSEDQWEFWWEANDDAFLNLKDRMRRGRVSTSLNSQLTSRLATDRNELATRTTAEDRARIVAVLLGSLDSKEADIVDSAVLSLARIVRAEDASSVLPAVIKVLSHPERTPRQSAALALGVLGAPE